MTDSISASEIPVPAASASPGGVARGHRLRLYVARMTPNSIRAEQHLFAVLNDFPEQGRTFDLEIIDVLTQQRRAITDGIIVTPTLTGSQGGLRKMMVGDLNNAVELLAFLQSLQTLAGD
jgi:hypothetical protein